MRASSVLCPVSAALILMSLVGCHEPKPQKEYGFSGGAAPAVVRPPPPASPEVMPAPPPSTPFAPPVPTAAGTPDVPLQEAPPVPPATGSAAAVYAPPARPSNYTGTVAAPAPVTYVPTATVPAGRRLATLYRYAGQYDEYFVRGDAAVSASPVLEGGVRLAAWDGQNAQETTRVAVATAVYFFSIPPDARALSIQVGYANADVARGSAIAGFLFVRDRAVERRYAPTGGDTQGGAFDEPAFYGNTYLLPGDQMQTVIDLASDERVTDGVLELHLSAGAGQAFDAQYIQVTALAADLPPTIVRQEVVQEVHDPYMYTYAYYYSGPWACSYPTANVRYVFFANDLDPFFYGGWITFRACFWNYHPWRYRPAYYTHWDGDDGHRAHFPPRGAPRYVVAYRDDWCRRNFHIEQRQLQDPVAIDSRVHHRRVAVADEARRADFQQYTQTITEKVRDTDHGLKASYGHGFAQHTQEWQRNPAAADRDLKPFKDKTQGMAKAAAALGSLPVKPVTAPPPRGREALPRLDTKPLIPPAATPTPPLPPSPPDKGRVGGVTPPAAPQVDTGSLEKPEHKKIRTEPDKGAKGTPTQERGTIQAPVSAPARIQPPEKGVPPTSVPATVVPPVTPPVSVEAPPATSARPERVPKTRGTPATGPASGPAATPSPAPTPAPTVTAPTPTVPGDTVKGTQPVPDTDRERLPDERRRKPSRPAAPEVTAPSAPVPAPPAEVPAPRVRLVPPQRVPPAKVVVPPVAVPDVTPADTVVAPDTTPPADGGPDGTETKRDKKRARDRDQQ